MGRALRSLNLLIVAILVAGCRPTTPEADEQAREASAQHTDAGADSTATMIDATVPTALAGDSGWKYAQRATADFDGDGDDETAVLISDVALDARGRPLWEDGHRWQLYVQEHDGKTTRLYARFLPRGRVTADVGVPAAGTKLFIVLTEQSPERLGVYEYEYRGPNNADVRRRVERELDGTKQFTGSPRP